MDRQLFTYTNKLEKCKMFFYLPNNTFTNYINIDNQVNLRDLRLRQIRLIIGLNLPFSSFNGCIITTSSMTFLSYPLLGFTSESAQKRGGITHPSSSPYCNTCTDNSVCTNNNNISVEPVNSLDNFQDSSFYELLEIP